MKLPFKQSSHNSMFVKILRKVIEKVNHLLIYVRYYKFKAAYYIYRVHVKGEGVWYAIAKAKKLFPDLEWGRWWVKIWGRKIEAGDPRVLRDLLGVILPEAIKYYKFKYKHDTILDIGAFVGETAIWFIMSGQAKRVIAVEPVPTFAYLAKKNTQGLPIEVLNLAVSKPGVNKAVIIIDDKIPAASKTTHNRTDIVKVKAVDLAYLITIYNPDGMKIDCEGCEEVLLYVPCNILNKLSEIISELHSKYVCASAIREKMVRCGFKEEVLVEGKYVVIVRWWR